MWKLTIEDDEGQRTSLELAREQYSIGRAEGASIRLTERNVSRTHALIKLADGQWVIEDSSSYNGTYVNGGRVDGTVNVANGDVIQLGDYRLELADEATAAAQETEQEDVAATQKRPPRFIVVIGPVPGVEYPLVGDRVGIGRAEECGVSINHSSVSRLHAEMVPLGDGRWEIIDQGSANGLRINGTELRRGLLEMGDALELGDVRLRFVGEGKWFRPAIDLSQQLPAVPLEQAAAAEAISKRRSASRILGAVALIAVVLVAGYMMFGRPDPGTDGGQAGTAAPMATNLEAAQKLVGEARQLADSDPEAAHARLRRIPANSPVRSSEDFKYVEAKWADSMFEKAAATDDLAEKRRLLTEISNTRTVDAERRTKANQMLLELPEEKTPDPRPTGDPSDPLPTAEPGATTSVASGPTGTASKTKTTPSGPEPGGKFDMDAQRQQLEGTVWSGNATDSQIKTLRAICSAQGDRACRDRCTQMLNK